MSGKGTGKDKLNQNFLTTLADGLNDEDIDLIVI